VRSSVTTRTRALTRVPWFSLFRANGTNQNERARRDFEACVRIDEFMVLFCVLKILYSTPSTHPSVSLAHFLLTDALAAKLDAQNALELAENLLVRDSLALLVLLNNLRLFVDLLRQLRLRELLRQSTLKNRLLHVGAHRLVRQVFVVELELERVTSRPRVYARAVNKKSSSVSQSLCRCLRSGLPRFLNHRRPSSFAFRFP